MKSLLIVVLFATLVRGQPPPPKDFDWREKGVVPPVKNQGMIGDSLMLSGVSAAESFYAIGSGKLEELSVFEAHDCCAKGGGSGGGLYYDIFNCFATTGGLCTEAAYPKQSGTCMNSTCTGLKGMTGGKAVTPGDESALMEMLLLNPVLVAVDASHVSFQEYREGIYSEPDCSSRKLDHTLVVVGYGMSSHGEEYWICQNSWGESWGDKGYIMIAKNKGNMCGIATEAYVPC